MLSRLTIPTLRSGLVLFWAVWTSLIVLTNLTDVLVQLGLLHDGFSWASYNFDLVVETVARQGAPPVAGALLFGLAVTWEFAAAVLLWRAWSRGRAAAGGWEATVQAFTVSIALWASFLIATEIFVAYETAGTHKTTLIAQLATLVILGASLGPDTSSGDS